MRLTDFHETVENEFGALRGAALLRDHVLAALGGRTAEQAIEAGWEPRDVWRALAAEFDVPPERI
jgi:hypothetical protein